MNNSTGAGTSNNSTGYYKEKIPKGYSKGKLQNFTPEAMDLLQSLYGHVGPDSYLAKIAGGDQQAFADLEAPALQQFSALQGGLASRFSAGGSAGGGQQALSSRNSSGFSNTMNQQSADFAQQLQSQRLDLRNQALKDLFSMSHTLMNEQPYENRLIKKDQGTDWGQIIGKYAGALPGFAAAAFGKGTYGGAAKGAFEGVAQGINTFAGG